MCSAMRTKVANGRIAANISGDHTGWQDKTLAVFFSADDVHAVPDVYTDFIKGESHLQETRDNSIY